MVFAGMVTEKSPSVITWHPIFIGPGPMFINSINSEVTPQPDPGQFMNSLITSLPWAFDGVGDIKTNVNKDTIKRNVLEEFFMIGWIYLVY